MATTFGDLAPTPVKISQDLDVPSTVDIQSTQPGGTFGDLAPTPGEAAAEGIDYTPKSRGTFADLAPPVTPSATEAAEQKLAVAEQTAGDLGVLDRAKSAGLSIITPVIDALSVFNYPIAGAVEELGTGDPGISLGDVGRAAKRAKTEFWNALPFAEDPNAKRRSFGEVFENIGWENTTSLSDVISPLYSETGKEWLQFKKGGFWDFTGRGATGLAADIIFDPITYVTLGTKDALKIALKSGQKTIAKKYLSNAGEQAFTKTIASETTAKVAQKTASEISDIVARTGITPAEAAEVVKISAKDIQKEAAKEALVEAERKMGNVWLSDPENAAKYFTAGGINFMGKELPGTGKAIRWMSDYTTDARIAATRKLEQVSADKPWLDGLMSAGRYFNAKFSSMGKLFRRDKAVDPVYLAKKQEMIDKFANIISQEGSKLFKETKGLDLSAQEWDEIIRAMDDEVRENGELLVRGLSGTAVPSVGPIPAELGARVLRRVSNPDLKTPMVERAVGHAFETLRKLDDAEMDQWGDDLVRMAKGTVNVESNRVLGGALTDSIAEEVKEVILRNLPSPTSAGYAAAVKGALKQNPDDIAEMVFNSLRGKPALLEEMKVLLKEYPGAVKNIAYQHFLRTYHSNIPMFFNNRASVTQSGVAALRDKFGMYFNEDKMLGRYSGFYSSTSRQAIRDALKTVSAADVSLGRVRPVDDLRDIIRRRVDMHAEEMYTAEWRNYIFDNHTIDTAFPVDAGGGNVSGKALNLFRNIEDITSGRNSKLPLAMRQRLDAAHSNYLARLGGLKRSDRDRFKTPTGFGRLSDEAKKYWIAKEMLQAMSQRDIREVLFRYGEAIEANPSLLPKFRSYADSQAADLGTYKQGFEVKTAVGTMKADVPVEIFDDFVSYRKGLIDSRDVNTLVQAYDWANNFWKTWVTVPFPSFTGRNMYGNVALGFTDAGWAVINPVTVKQAALLIAEAFASGRGRKTLDEKFLKVFDRAKVMASLEDKMKNTPIKTKTGQEYSLWEVKGIGRDLGVWTDDIKLFELAGEYSPYATGRAEQKYKNLERAMRTPNELAENHARLLMFITHLKRGMTPVDAAARVKEFLFDYSNLSQWEKEFMRRTIPFYTFFRKNMPLQVREALRDPGKLSTQVKILNDRSSENDRLATWQAPDGTYMRLNRDGENLERLDGVDLPMFQLKYFDALLGSKDKQRELASMLAPQVRFIWEYPLQTDTFSGKPLGPQQYAMLGAMVENWPKAYKDYLGWQRKLDRAGRPVYIMDRSKLYFIPLIGEAWATSRILRTGDKAFQAALAEGNTDFLQWFLTGTRNISSDLRVEDYKKIKQRTMAIEQELLKRGVKTKKDITDTELY